MYRRAVTDSRRIAAWINVIGGYARVFMGLLVQIFLDRSQEFVCDRCGTAFLSGVCRFEAGRRAGALCHICAGSKLSFPLSMASKMPSSFPAWAGGLRRRRRHAWPDLVAGLIAALTLAGMLSLSWHAWAALQQTVS
jgi:hypothetical protein